MTDLVKQNLECSSCRTKPNEGLYIKGYFLCSTCQYKYSSCPKCYVKLFKDNLCSSCGFKKILFECQSCNKSSADGKITNGMFKCDDCLIVVKTSDPKYCPSCHKLTLKTDDVTTYGTITGGGGCYIEKTCPCGYHDKYNWDY